MSMYDSLPEESTTPLFRAQWTYDRMVELRSRADAALREAEKKVVDAGKKLDDEKRKSAPPVDRSARQLASGAPVPDDNSHTEKKANGQQREYVVLSPAERAKGFSRPLRDAYRHKKCGAITTMSRALAETYARDPYFYSGTFCTHCGTHFPVGEDGEFTWYENDGSEGPKVGT